MKNLVNQIAVVSTYTSCGVALVGRSGHKFFTLKKYAFLFSFLLLLFNSALGEIKNGYEKDVVQMRSSLRRYSALLQINNNLTPQQRRKIAHRIDSLVNNLSNYELTENLLKQFKDIAPDLYAEIDTLKDITGRNVRVYVKFIPVNGTKIKAWGTTYMREMTNNKNAFCSEYGMYTVSVKIWIVNKALFVLAHELGHVRYQVPHFAKYMTYYKNNYTFRIHPALTLGHNGNDSSGKSATDYVKRFRKEFIYFLKMKKARFESPLILMTKIRKNLTDEGIIL